MSTRLNELRAKSLRQLKVRGVIALLVAGTLVAYGLVTRARGSEAVKAWTQAQAIPTVDVILPQVASGKSNLTLPGNIQALYDAPIHARVSGYLKRWYVDIGARVKAGQLLATIDTPELDQQLAQARADAQTAQANLALAQVTARRWQRLLAEDAVSQQESDEKQGDLAAKTALANAAKANVDRLAALESFKNIVAPFDGVVTARKTDVGALVSAGGDNGPELFRVADIHKLRVYVYVPQSFSARIEAGMVAKLTVPEYPGRTFSAQLTSTSNAINDRSGMLLAELIMENPQGELKPGDYVQVQFNVARSGNTVRVPATALVFREQGLQIATLSGDSRVHMKNVRIASDAGTYVDIADGLNASDRVIDSPPDSIAEGDLVRVSGQTATLMKARS